MLFVVALLRLIEVQRGGACQTVRIKGETPNECKEHHLQKHHCTEEGPLAKSRAVQRAFLIRHLLFQMPTEADMKE